MKLKVDSVVFGDYEAALAAAATSAAVSFVSALVLRASIDFRSGNRAGFFD